MFPCVVFCGIVFRALGSGFKLFFNIFNTANVCFKFLYVLTTEFLKFLDPAKNFIWCKLVRKNKRRIHKPFGMSFSTFNMLLTYFTGLLNLSWKITNPAKFVIWSFDAFLKWYNLEPTILNQDGRIFLPPTLWQPLIKIKQSSNWAFTQPRKLLKIC